MEMEEMNRLEERILKAVDLIQTLRSEREMYREGLEKAQTLMKSQAGDAGNAAQLQEQVDDLGGKLAALTKSRTAIRGKVDSMIRALETVAGE